MAGARIARLATRNPAGGVDLVPVTFALCSPDVLVTAVDHKPKRHGRLQRLANVAAEPEVTVLVDHYDDADWAALWWVRLRGEARVVPPGDPAQARAVAALAEKYAQYVATPPAGDAIVVEVRAWRGWSAGPSPAPEARPDGSGEAVG